ncbi:peptidoglycan-binding protein [Streptomyces sp. NPDC021012]|uniref:peptidoglycan-binding protein n=1 Tax=Streptomyces sp. NPDC021012 TaxID=3365107 RepID=UPI0037AFE0A4
MTDFHVAVDHLDPDTLTVSTTYLGTVDQAHVDEVRAIAGLDTTERWVKEHPRQPGAFSVLRDDGKLDVYVPTDAPAFAVRTPDLAPKGDLETGGTPTADATASVGETTPGTALPARKTSAQKKAAATVATTLVAFAATSSGGPAYIDGAVRFGDQSIGGAMDTPGNPPRMTWHTTESPSGKSYFYSVAAYLIRAAAEPQVIYDPASDLIGQFGPLTQSGRALRNDGTRRTNREGKVNIQVEVLARAKDPWTDGFDPANKPNYRKLIAAGRAHGIPDDWPAGKPVPTPSSPMKRDRTTWQTQGGHYGHCHVPGNDHWDPGPINTTIVPGKAASTGGTTPSKPPTGGTNGTGTPARYQVTINGLPYGYGATGTHITKVGRALVANGCSAYKTGPGPEWTDADTLSYQKWQKKLGYSGTAADGVPGEESLRKLLGYLPAKAPTTPKYAAFPGPGFFSSGRRDPLITAVGRRLVAEGCSAYARGPGEIWTNADRESYRRWQKKLGYTGADADGIPGKKSWDALKVPHQL